MSLLHTDVSESPHAAKDTDVRILYPCLKIVTRVVKKYTPADFLTGPVVSGANLDHPTNDPDSPGYAPENTASRDPSAPVEKYNVRATYHIDDTGAEVDVAH